MAKYGEPETGIPGGELARIITYLAGFVVGLFVLVLGVLSLVGIWGNSEYGTELIALGLLITGLGGTAVVNVPSLQQSWKKNGNGEAN